MALEAQIHQRLVILAPKFAVDFEEPCEQVAGAGRIDLIDNFVQECIVYGQVAFAELLGKNFEPKAAGCFIAGGIASVDHGRDIDGRVPGVNEQREALIGISRQREAAECIAADPNSRFIPGTSGSENREFGAALVDVVLQSIGSNRRGTQYYLNLGRDRVMLAAEVLR